MSTLEIHSLEISTENISIIYADETTETLPNTLDTYKLFFKRWSGGSEQSLRHRIHPRMMFPQPPQNTQLLHTFMIQTHNLHILTRNSNADTSKLENDLTAFFQPSNKENIRKFLNYLIKLYNISLIEKSMTEL